MEELEREMAVLTVRLEVERGRLDRVTVMRERLEELAAEGVALEMARLPEETEPVGGVRVAGVQTVTAWREGMTSVDLAEAFPQAGDRDRGQDSTAPGSSSSTEPATNATSSKPRDSGARQRSTS